jgi:hypothetical protein
VTRHTARQLIPVIGVIAASSPRARKGGHAGALIPCAPHEIHGLLPWPQVRRRLGGQATVAQAKKTPGHLLIVSLGYLAALDCAKCSASLRRLPQYAGEGPCIFRPSRTLNAASAPWKSVVTTPPKSRIRPP